MYGNVASIQLHGDSHQLPLILQCIIAFFIPCQLFGKHTGSYPWFEQFKFSVLNYYWGQRYLKCLSRTLHIKYQTSAISFNSWGVHFIPVVTKMFNLCAPPQCPLFTIKIFDKGFVRFSLFFRFIYICHAALELYLNRPPPPSLITTMPLIHNALHPMDACMFGNSMQFSFHDKNTSFFDNLNMP